MKYIRIISIFLAVLILLCNFTACVPGWVQNEQEIYQKSLDSFFKALDSGNKDDIEELFSKTVLKNDADLGEQIDKLISIYSGGETEIKFDGIIGGEYETEDGKRKSTVFGTFPVVNRETFYWCYVELTYEDDFSSDNIGLNRVRFYTADEYCLYFNDENPEEPTDIGLLIFAEKKLENEVRCINNLPFEFTPIERKLDLAEIESFLTSNKSYKDFTAKFGQPNAKSSDNSYYYEVPNEYSNALYVEIYAENDNVIYANLLDSFSFIRSIIEE